MNDSVCALWLTFIIVVLHCIHHCTKSTIPAVQVTFVSLLFGLSVVEVRRWGFWSANNFQLDTHWVFERIKEVKKSKGRGKKSHLPYQLSNFAIEYVKSQNNCSKLKLMHTIQYTTLIATNKYNQWKDVKSYSWQTTLIHLCTTAISYERHQP